LCEDGLLARARALAPVLNERALSAERLRRLPDETHADFVAAGFYRTLQPARFGGMELDYGIQTLIARELAKGCASSAWVCAILACHSWVAGMYPVEAQEEIWSDDPEALVSTSFLPAGISAERRGGGLRLSGRWRFSSGVDRCRWAILLVPLPPEGGGPPDPLFVLVDLAACRIEETWNSVGLSATGSNDIVVEEVDVPVHRIVRVLDLRGEETAGSKAHGHYLYRLPLFGVFPFNIVGPALGAARGALEDVIADMTSRRSVTGADLTKIATVHQRIGRATALLDGADAVLAALRAEIVAKGHAGEVFAVADRARYRLNLGHAAQSCCEAVDEILPLTGGRGLEGTHPMQRAWRDVHAAAQHVGLVWDVQTGLYSSVLLGHGSPDPKL
jgi:alkylation response protein AidB-like acyl-CoA dehydrogenase